MTMNNEINEINPSSFERINKYLRAILNSSETRLKKLENIKIVAAFCLIKLEN